jgi:hypothetical protein
MHIYIRKRSLKHRKGSGSFATSLADEGGRKMSKNKVKKKEAVDDKDKKYYLVVGVRDVYSKVPFKEYIEVDKNSTKELVIDIALAKSNPIPEQLYDGVYGSDDKITTIVEITEEAYKQSKED